MATAGEYITSDLCGRRFDYSQNLLCSAVVLLSKKPVKAACNMAGIATPLSKREVAIALNNPDSSDRALVLDTNPQISSGNITMDLTEC
jgi:hypothetical protein